MRIEKSGKTYRVINFREGSIFAVDDDGKIHHFEYSQVKVTAFDEPLAEVEPDPYEDTLLPLLERVVEIQQAALERQPSATETLYVVVLNGVALMAPNGVSPAVWNRKAIAEVVAVQRIGVVMTTDEYVEMYTKRLAEARERGE